MNNIRDDKNMTSNTLSTEELLQRAQGQALHSMVSTIGYLRSKGLSLEEWAQYLGRKVIPFWTHLKELPLPEVARQIAMANADFTPRIVSISGDDNQAEAVLEINVSDLLQLYDITEDDFGSTMEIARPGLESFGIQYSWSRSGNTYTLHFAR
jgi:hypothetical protein